MYAGLCCVSGNVRRVSKLFMVLNPLTQLRSPRIRLNQCVRAPVHGVQIVRYLGNLEFSVQFDTFYEHRSILVPELAAFLAIFLPHVH